MTYKIITLGCKVNAYESEVMSEALKKKGYVLDEEKPNIIIINTCSVTNTADNKSKKIIRSEKRNNPSAIIIACGCSTENNKEDYKNMGIDILLGTHGKSKIVSLLDKYLTSKCPIEYFNNDKDFEDMEISTFQNHTRGFIKIQDGCNNFCTYCIIPYVRGRIRSKDINTVYEETLNLVNNGYKEIVLTGIDTGSYNFDGYDLTDLIEKLSTIKALERIRLSSIEITQLNDKFLKMFKTNKKLVSHLHIPLQAGSNHILKLMNRKYTKEEFLSKVNILKSIRPDVNLTTDCLTGFPSETEDDFKETLAFCKEIGFTKIHTFPYSERKGTLASTMPQLDMSIRKKRAKELITLSNKLEREYNESFIGKIVEVLVEETLDNMSIGHTECYLKVGINSYVEKNTIVKVKITNANNTMCIGNLIIK